MLSVAEARARIVAAFHPLGSEQVGLMNALGRVLARDVAARVTQPPVDVSAMDGYAVRATDVASVPTRLRVIGQAPAGGSYDHPVGPGETVRIFTGGPLPAGTDTIIIQEDATAEGDRVIVRERAPRGTYVRQAGLDFKRGDVLLRKGRILTSRDVGIAAAMNVPWLAVTRRPRIAVLATGDEVVMPGDPLGRHQIVSSNGLSLAAFVAACGGDPIHLGIAPDDRDALCRMAEGAVGTDLLVTSGGASVGDHDLVQAVLGEAGMTVDFWKIAMRPGKPLMFGRIGATPVLGVPGNPVSTLVCATMFLRPAIDAMLGRVLDEEPQPTALLGRDLPANDSREDYLRARLSYDAQGRRVATPFDRQDSSMLSLMSAADCLVRRAPRAPAISAGSTVDIVLLSGGCLSI
jgi:molybdopterin molybdotransferase